MTPLRLTIVLSVLLLPAVLPAQNPLAPQSDPYSGVFQNDQMKLELNKGSGEYGGVIQFQGQILPLKGRIQDGALQGYFESNGQSFNFRATRKGGQLNFQTDGAAYILESANTRQSVKSNDSAPGSLVGSWQSDRGIVRINADGTANIGTQSHHYTISSNVITFTGGAEPIRIPYDLAGDTWTWIFPDAKVNLTRVNAAAPSTTGNKLTGAWQGPNGTVQIDPGGSLVFNGDSYRYTQSGNYLTITGQGQTFLVAVQQTGDSMTWQISGKTWTFIRGAAGAQAASTGTSGGVLQELVGTWCQSSYSNNSAGTYGRSTCFTLYPNGTYKYGGESSASGQNGGAASSNSDAGTWTATANTFTATSAKTGVHTYRMEKRNHPKNHDAMLVMDGAAFTTTTLRPPWP